MEHPALSDKILGAIFQIGDKTAALEPLWPMSRFK
jgi:hypothetical protein